MNTTAINKKTSWWPKLIIATFVGFGLFIGNMVRLAMKTDVDLVSQDYYKKEIAYQQHINQVSATHKLDNDIMISHAAAAEQLSLVFPKNLATDKVTGMVHFFRPSDAKMDFELPLTLNSDGQQHIRTSEMSKGLWRVQLNWQANNQHYFLQKDIIIN